MSPGPTRCGPAASVDDWDSAGRQAQDHGEDPQQHEAQLESGLAAAARQAWQVIDRTVSVWPSVSCEKKEKKEMRVE